MQNTPSLSSWHTLPGEQVSQELKVNPAQGLAPGEIAERLQTYGPNELEDKGGKSPWAILWEQLTAPLVLVLVFAATISGVLGKWDSFIAIVAIVILNAVLGLVQEYRAEKAMAALKQMAAPLVKVRRGGQNVDIPSREVVPGDVIVLEAGNIIAADARVLEVNSLQVQEASLTGESYPVEKTTQAFSSADMPLGDRKNMLYMGTSVTHGRGLAVVVNTGMRSELGRIATLIQSAADEDTPLQIRMAELGRVLLVVAFAVMILAGVVGTIDQAEPEDILLSAVAISVAVVPEGLLAVVTISLALGAQRMLARRALIRKLPAVETLGSVTVICSDKTGTLTQNRMTVKIIDTAGARHNLFGIDPDHRPDTTQSLLMTTGALCNDASLRHEAGKAEALMIGDPTEGALLVMSEKFGLYKDQLEAQLPRVGEVPFSSERKRMTTVHQLPARGAAPELDYLHDLAQGAPYIAFSKGGVDNLLEVCEYVWEDGQVHPLTADWRERIEKVNNELATEGLRVLGLAYHPVEGAQGAKWDHAEAQEVFIGLVGIIDPPRPEVREAVRICKAAGIRPVMITGDHPLTAKSIARDLGIIESDTAKVLTGYELAKMSDDQIDASVKDTSVYARVSPEHKLKIVRGMQRHNNIAAMTGDGVNDAPALKQSNIGVAMGITGTDVSKEASDMVILDDNFATIVSAVEEGRTIYDNVRRFVKYLLASNTGELMVLLVTQLIAGMTIPLTTLQILWMNLITDGIPALALGVEKAEAGAMKRAPYAPNESIFGRGLARHILIIGSIMGASGVALGYWAYSTEQMATNGEVAWNTMVFFFLTIAQMGHALALRSHRESLFTVGVFGNPYIWGAVIFTVGIQLLAIYLPFFNNIFNTNPLTLEQLLICTAASTVVFLGAEGEKLLMRMGVLK